MGAGCLVSYPAPRKEGSEKMSRATKTLVGVFLRAWGRGKATLLTVTVALLLATLTPAFGATGGNFILGKSNSATTISRLTANVARAPALQIFNTNTAPASTALNLVVAAGHPPLWVNPTAGKAINLNADKVDGLDSTQLQGAKAYAHINADGTLDPSRSKNVDKSRGFSGATYCVNSTVTPHNVVATIDASSPFGEIVTNSNIDGASCADATGGYNIQVYTASSTGAPANRAFKVVIN